MSDIFHRVAPAKQPIPKATPETVNAQSAFGTNQTNINNTSQFPGGSSGPPASLASGYGLSSNYTMLNVFESGFMARAPIDPFVSSFGGPTSQYLPINSILNSNGGSLGNYYGDIGAGRLIINGLRPGIPPTPPFTSNATLPYLDFNAGVADGVSTCIFSINSGDPTFPVDIIASDVLLNGVPIGGSIPANLNATTLTLSPTDNINPVALTVNIDVANGGAYNCFKDINFSTILTYGVTTTASSYIAGGGAGDFGSGILNFQAWSTINMQGGQSGATSTILNVDGINCGTINGVVPGIPANLNVTTVIATNNAVGAAQIECVNPLGTPVNSTKAVTGYAGYTPSGISQVALVGIDYNPGSTKWDTYISNSVGNGGSGTLMLDGISQISTTVTANLNISSINGVAPTTLEQSQKQNITGFATILLGNTSVSVPTPVSSNLWGAVVTPSTNMGGGNYWVQSTSVSSFTINIASNAFLPQTFFYSAIAL